MTNDAAVTLKVKASRLHLEGVDVKIPRVDLPRLDRGRSIPWIRASGRTVSELVSPTGRQLEVHVAFGQPGKVAAKIEELLRDQMNDAAFELQHIVSGSGDARTECFESDTKR
jgi:hypothetical protein